MTARFAGSAVVATLFVVVATAVTGCSQSRQAGRPGPAASTSVTAATAALPRPVPAGSARPAGSAGSARRDVAVWAAVKFELAHCQWDWRSPLAVYVGAQRADASPDYGQRIAAAANAASWEQEVVAEHQVVTCIVSSPVRVPNAPSTTDRVYVRMTSESHITSTLGSFDAGSSTASWVVELVGGRWLVTGSFEGG